MSDDALPAEPLPSLVRTQSAPATFDQTRFPWSAADAAHLGPSRITITRMFQRAPKAPYHHLASHLKIRDQPVARSSGPSTKKRCVTLDAGPVPFRDNDDASDSSDSEDSTPTMPFEMRSSSAPPEDTAPPEARPVPRISDDTAILRAFLSRATASKRSIPAHKRESLENRRDSDVVRQALASTDKSDVLTELDPNTPASPTKPSSPDADVDVDVDVEMETAVEKPTAISEVPEQAPSKAPRRGLRTRTRMATPNKPAKITIRSAADHIALKKTEAQEMSLATRANTRKNKGKSLMPVARLRELANEQVALEPHAQIDQAPLGRRIQWDTTLAYYQEFTSEPPSPLPVRSSRRTTRTSLNASEPLPAPSAEADAPTDIAAALTVEQEQPHSSETSSPPEQPPLPKPAPSKKRSRIATPARPAKTVSAKPVQSLPPPPVLPPPQQPKPAEAQESRFGTPKKPPIPFIGAKSASFSKIEFAPKQHDGAPAAPGAAPSIPGISSPAKKRARSALGKSAVKPVQRNTMELPSLTSSPAKRKRTGIKFS